MVASARLTTAGGALSPDRAACVQCPHRLLDSVLCAPFHFRFFTARPTLSSHARLYSLCFCCANSRTPTHAHAPGMCSTFSTSPSCASTC